MKILIRLPNWLGDVVMASAFVTAVRDIYPGAVVDVVIKKELAGIGGMIPGIGTIHPFSKKDNNGLTGAYRFGKTLKKQQYDLFFNLPTSLSSLVLGWATGAKKRIGFAKEGGVFMLSKACKKPLNVHRVDEYLSLLEQFTERTVTDRAVSIRVPDTIEKDRQQLIINFNSEAESRRMPVYKAVAIVNLLAKTFGNLTLTFIGSPKEAAFAGQIIAAAENTNRINNMAGKTDLAGLASLMASSVAVLTTDSGPAHLANSLGTPTVVLFGAGNEHNTAPYNKGNLAVVRYGKLPCEPCVKNTCRLYGVPKCMEMIEEFEIINALNVYLPDA